MEPLPSLQRELEAHLTFMARDEAIKQMIKWRTMQVIEVMNSSSMTEPQVEEYVERVHAEIVELRRIA
jgi:hypothetical protein